MDSEGVIKVAWRNPSVFLMSFLCPTSPLLSLLLYFSPLILSTAALCAIALVDIVPHETESEPVEQIVAVWLQWLMGMDRRSDPVCSDNNIPSTSQAFDTPPPAADHDIMPKDRISLEYGGSYDEESVLESDSEEEYEEESSTEELEVCERMIKTQGALDLITFELHKIVMAAQNFMSTLRKWLPVISSIMATFERKQTEENLTGVHVYGVLLKFQNISVRLHEELEQHILKFPEDYKQKATLGRQLTTSVESCKLQCQREQSDISFESFSGLREKYDAEDSSLWMQDFSSSDEEKASECSSDPDSSSLADLEKISTARNSTNYSDQSLKEEPASKQIMEPAGILSEAIISRHKCSLNASKEIVSKEQDATLYTGGDTVPAGIKLVLDSSKDAEINEESHPPVSINMVTDEEEASTKDMLIGQSTTTRLMSKYSKIRPVKSWPTLQEVLATRSKESFPYLMKTGMNSISSRSKISNSASCMAIKVKL